MEIFGRLETLLYEPAATPEQFCAAQPCVDVHIGQANFVLCQPTSSALVYVLGLLWIGAGLYFWKIRGGRKSRAWWAAALVLGGAAAISAGTSYQAFGYELKCSGRDLCIWTNWWEIAYMVMQVASMDAMLAAVAHSSAAGRLRRALIVYSVLNFIVYVALTAVGSFIPVRFLISFEMLVLFSVPNLVMVLAVCASRYRRLHEPMDMAILGASAWLVLTTAAYFVYMTMGYTQKLWARGIWFSDNDVLHVLMIGWLIYLCTSLAGKLEDAP